MKRILFLLALSFFIFIIYVLTGSISIFSMLDKKSLLVYRIQRGLFGFLIGGSLGVSGFFYQLVLQNPLADPFVIGVSQVAAVGSVLAFFYFSLSYPSAMLFSLLFSFLYIGLFFLLPRKIWKNSFSFLLVGITFNIMFSSLLGFLIIYSSHQGELHFWLWGSISRFSKISLYILSILHILFFGIIYFNRRLIFSLYFDEKVAQTSGFSTVKARNLAFFVASVLSAVTVSFAGIIGFVGLIVPHLSRYFVRSHILYNYLYTFFLGGVLLLLADGLIRTIFSAQQIPIGIITGLLGSLFFLKLLFQKIR